jgi:Cupin-like domain
MRPTGALLHLRFRRVPILPDASTATFRRLAFDAERPYLLPRGTFGTLPAIQDWFQAPSSSSSSSGRALNVAALQSFSTVPVSTELTSASASGSVSFQRAEAPLSFFLGYVSAFQDASSSSSAPQEPDASLAIAQSPLSHLPEGMQRAVPTPGLVLEAGKGDVYDASLWLGRAPTVTPLHRDPNPNLLVQIAGIKRVRLLDPARGSAVRKDVVGELDSPAREGGMGMMAGREREALESVVWEAECVEEQGDGDGDGGGFETEIAVGDGLFIPKGWWHAVHGVGLGITGSVNWWFR